MERGPGDELPERYLLQLPHLLEERHGGVRGRRVGTQADEGAVAPQQLDGRAKPRDVAVRGGAEAPVERCGEVFAQLVDILLRRAGGVDQQQRAVAGRLLDQPARRRAVVEEVARKPLAAVPLPQPALPAEELLLVGRLEVVEREGRVALAGKRREGGLLHGVERVGRGRGVGLGEQRREVLRGAAPQSEELGEGVVAQCALPLGGERGHPVGGVAHGTDAAAAHGGVDAVGCAVALLTAHGVAVGPQRADEAPEAAPRGNHPRQVCQFEVAVGVDQPREEHSAVELHAGQTVGLGALLHAEDTPPGVDAHQRVAQKAPGLPEQVRGYPPDGLRGRIHRRRCGCRVGGCRGSRRPAPSGACSRCAGRAW